MYNIKEKKEVVSKLIKKKKVKYLIPKQIIVYYNTVEKTKQLVTVLEYICYYQQIKNRVEKSKLI